MHQPIYIFLKKNLRFIIEKIKSLKFFLQQKIKQLQEKFTSFTVEKVKTNIFLN